MSFDGYQTLRFLQSIFRNRARQHQRRGLLIAFVGMDGTGKSTLSRKAANLALMEGNSTILINPKTYFILERLVTIVRQFLSKRANNRPSTRYGGNPLLTVGQKPLLLKLWPIVAIFDFLLYYFLLIRPALSVRNIVISDRYFYDRIIGFQYYGYSNNLISSLCYRLTPRPDLLFVLDAPPLVARIREKEPRHEPEFYVTLRPLYLKLSRDLSTFLVRSW